MPCHPLAAKSSPSHKFPLSKSNTKSLSQAPGCQAGVISEESCRDSCSAISLNCKPRHPMIKICYSAVRSRRMCVTPLLPHIPPQNTRGKKSKPGHGWGCELRMHLEYSSKDHTLSKSCSAAFHLVLMNFALSSSSQLQTEPDALAKTDVRYSCIFVSHLQWTPSVTKSAGNISWQHQDLQLLGNKT